MSADLEDLYVSHVAAHVLARLKKYRDGMTMSELKRSFKNRGFTEQALGEVIDRLEGMGKVEIINTKVSDRPGRPTQRFRYVG
jgi:predicted hydrolase (HD superfamily)